MTLNRKTWQTSGLLIITGIILTACSFSMRGTVTDIITGVSIKDAKVRVELGEGRDPREVITAENGAYRIKKDNRDQLVTYTAEGYEDYPVTIKKEKTRNTYLIPTPSETARRIVQTMLDGQYEEAYKYLHPNYQGATFTLEKFREINSGDFASYLALVKEFRIETVTAMEQYRDVPLNKVYNNVIKLQVILVIELEGTYENTWDVYLQRMTDPANGKDFYHWIFNRTSNN